MRCVGRLPVVELLLSSSSVRVNAATSTGWTALYAAALNGHDAIVDALLAKALFLSLSRSFARALYLFFSLYPHPSDTLSLSSFCILQVCGLDHAYARV